MEPWLLAAEALGDLFGFVFDLVKKVVFGLVIGAACIGLAAAAIYTVFWLAKYVENHALIGLLFFGSIVGIATLCENARDRTK